MAATVSPVEQRMIALAGANSKRSAILDLRRRVSSGTLTVAELIADPPQCLETMAICDVLRLARKGQRSQPPEWFVSAGKKAVRDDVNLFIPLGRACVRTRAWTVRLMQEVTKDGRVNA